MNEEDEAFDEIARKQGMWGGGFMAKKAMAADKFIAAEERKVGERYGYVPKLHPSEWMPEGKWIAADKLQDGKCKLCVDGCAACDARAQPAQEPTEWQTMEVNYSFGKDLDIRMGDGSILCNVFPQSDGDLWWSGAGTGDKFIDPKYADITHWRIHSNTTPPQREWVGLTPEETSGFTQHEMTVVKYVSKVLQEKNG